MTTAYDIVLERLAAATGFSPRGSNGQVSTRCPAHDARNPSLSVGRGADGQVLLTCHGGCSLDEVLKAIGLTPADLFEEDARRPRDGTDSRAGRVRVEATYPYVDEHGTVLFVTERLRGGPQRFRQRQPDGTPHIRGVRRVLFRLPDVLAAARQGREVYLSEGEKDVLAIERAGGVATTNPMGAGKWRDEFSDSLCGAHVTLIADKDRAGYNHARQVRRSLEGKAASVRVVEARTGKDAADHLAAGHTLEELVPVELDDEVGEGDEEPSTWAPMDLTEHLAGTYLVEEPQHLVRTDGRALAYPRRVHSLHGESESGKSWVAQYGAAQALRRGCRVLYLDFESDPGAVVGRLRDLGVPADVIASRFAYARPDVRPTATARAEQDFTAHLSAGYDYAVIDGVTDAMGLFGASTKDTDETAAFMRTFPRRLAASGPVVFLVDHVVKDADSRGRFAIGSQAKMAALDGAAYTVEVLEPLGRGMRGVLGIRVAKDRPGGVRPHCGKFRAGDRTQEAARFVLDARTEALQAELLPPAGDESDGTGDGFRPTAYMEMVSRTVEVTPDLSLSRIVERIGKRRATVILAAETLVRKGYLAVRDGDRNSKLHRSIRPYRQADDPRSDAYEGVQDQGTGRRPADDHETTATSSGPKGPGTGNWSRDGLSTDSGNRSGTGGNGSPNGVCTACRKAPVVRYGPNADPICSACRTAATNKGDRP